MHRHSGYYAVGPSGSVSPSSFGIRPDILSSEAARAARGARASRVSRGASAGRRLGRAMGGLFSAPREAPADRPLCCKCVRRAATNMCFPCGHLCLCVVCSEELSLRSFSGEETLPCPVCHSNILHIIDGHPASLFGPGQRPSSGSRCRSALSPLGHATERLRCARARATSRLRSVCSGLATSGAPG
mmetsp:Transcript_90329/g.292091  ORF Transcript_90329/g.292091 Transcript_90329/m.292091 type:complete len:187 (-) Transcript_90329:116-676(-)